MMHFLGCFMIALVVLSSTERAKCSPMEKNVDDLKSLEDQSRGSYESLDIYLSWIMWFCIISIISQLKSWYSRFASLGDNSGWIDGKICSYTVEPEDAIFSTFSGDTLKDLETAKNDCAEACNNKPECKYANLWSTDRTMGNANEIQYCYLSTNEECDGGKKIIDYWPCHLYTKAWDEIRDRQVWFPFIASILNASQFWKV